MKVLFPVVKASSGSDVYFTLLSNALERKGVKTRILWLSYRYEFLPFLARTAWPVARQYDIVHTNCDYGFLFKPPNTPLVVTLHHNVLDPYYQQYTSTAQKIYHYALLRRRIQKTLRSASAAVCVSDATRKSFAESFCGFDDKLSVIYNGIELEIFKPDIRPQISDRRILFVGNLSRRKGADLLVPIMDRLAGGYELVCISFSEQHCGYRDTIYYLNNLTPVQIVEQYRKCTVVLFPSRLEGFGYAAAEAMACAKPVVCSNRSSLPELIDNGRGGYVCDPEDVSSYAEALRKICESPGMAEEMGTYNRKKAQKMFDVDLMAERYLELYREIL